MRIREDIESALESCREKLSAMAASARSYIDLHDSYLEETTRDSKFIKERIKRKVVRVYDGD